MGLNEIRIKHQSTPCKHPVIVLQDVAWTDLHALVEFIYHGEVNVHQRSLSSFLKTAEVLRVSGLTQQHGEDREQLAQVQSLVRYPPTPPVSNCHPPNFADKLVSDSLFASPSSPPHGATVNQLLRRAALQHRRERRISMDPTENEHTKRPRPDILNNNFNINNNNNTNNNNNNNNNSSNELNLSQQQQQQMAPLAIPTPPQTQPADFSPSGLKSGNNALNLNVNSLHHVKGEFEGNGISSTERGNSPISPSPPGGAVKSEPMELLCGNNNSQQQLQQQTQDGDNSDDDSTETERELGGMIGGSNLPQGPHSGGSSGDHDERASPLGGGGGGMPPYLTASESKLFASAAASGFNFTMAALAADPSGLGGLNQSLTGNDTLAGTSQGVDEFRCQPCNKSLSSLTRLKRHIQNVHMRPSREPVCNICKRVYSSLNSLRNHKSIYHRNVKNMKGGDDPVAAAAAATANIMGAPPPPHHSFYL